MKTKIFLPSAHKLSYNDKKTLEDLANNVRYKRNNGLATTLEFMADEHIKIGRDTYFGGGDMPALKQHFHVSAKLQHLATTYDGTRQLWTNQLYDMLSDNSQVIQDWAALATEQFIKLCNKPTEFHFYTHMYQLAIREDYAELQAKLNLAKNSPDKKVLKNFGSKIELFTLFLERDKKGLEAQILALAKKWQTRINHNGMTRTVITAQAMATDAMEYAKLCWLKGIEVEIDHPLVPMELLPIKPLPHYDDVYDFLNPDWVPPPQNFIEKITKWFSK
jgi:hypothetical protein